MVGDVGDYYNNCRLCGGVVSDGPDDMMALMRLKHEGYPCCCIRCSWCDEIVGSTEETQEINDQDYALHLLEVGERNHRASDK